MTDQANFKHIRVSSGDDDVVIVAGAPTEGPLTALSAEEAAPEPAREEQSTAASREEKTPVHTAPARADGYQPTTLEDLQQSKMPLAQKVIVALAVLAVIAFVVWYVVF